MLRGYKEKPGKNEGGKQLAHTTRRSPSGFGMREATAHGKPRPQNLSTGHSLRLWHGGNPLASGRPCSEATRLVASGGGRAARGGGSGLLLHGHLHRRLGGHGNGEDMVGGFDLAEDALAAIVREAQGWFALASWTDFAGHQQHTRAVFKAGERQFRDIAILRDGFGRYLPGVFPPLLQIHRGCSH